MVVAGDGNAGVVGTRTPLWKHLIGLGWIVAAAGAVLAPEVVHGASFGPFDLLSHYGFLKQQGVTVHNPQAGDQIDAILPWFTTAWEQVHHGHLPLWNPYGALGMPLAFNWQSGAFALQSAIAYLFPVNWAYTVQIAATLVIAGSGAYVLGRVLRIGTLGCVFAGVAFELSGPMIGFLGYPHTGVMSFAGWLFAAVLLVMRGKHPARDVAFFALTMAFAAYAGQPEILVLLFLALAIFAGVLLLSRAIWDQGPIAIPIGYFAIGLAAGGALSAPLLLPGLQLISGSLRNVASLDLGLPAHDLTHLIFSSFDGLPTAGSGLFAFFYGESAAWVGVIVLVLAVVAVARRFRVEGVAALAVTALVTAAIIFVRPVVSIMNHLPLVGHIAWHRSLFLLAFALAILGGIGIDVMARAPSQRATRNWVAGSFAAMALILLGIWTFGRGRLSPAETSFRAHSFIWPAIGTAAGIAASVALFALARSMKNRGSHLADDTSTRKLATKVGGSAGVILLLCETGFLVASGASIWTSSPDFFSTPPAVASYQDTVGSSLVGFGPSACFLPPGLGIPSNDNDVYGVDQLAVYDPALPQEYFTAWKQLTGERAGFQTYYFYCPDVSSAAVARLYGVSFVLEQRGYPGPAGSVFDKSIDDEDLYSIPGAARATLSPLESTGRLPPIEAPGNPVAMTQPDPASWRLTTDTSTKEALRLRITDVPGWSATIDGRPLPLQSYAGVMIQAVVPPGRHEIVLRYWPHDFSLGLWLAAIAAIGLLLWLGIAAFMRRRTNSPPDSRSEGAPSEGAIEFPGVR
jgi:Bacterial membrane protein YfhO